MAQSRSIGAGIRKLREEQKKKEEDASSPATMPDAGGPENVAQSRDIGAGIRKLREDTEKKEGEATRIRKVCCVNNHGSI